MKLSIPTMTPVYCADEIFYSEDEIFYSNDDPALFRR